MFKVKLRPRNAIHFFFILFLGSKLFLYLILGKRFCFIFLCSPILPWLESTVLQGLKSSGFPQLTLQAWECIKDDHCLVPSHLPNAYLINHSLRPTFDLYKGASHFDSKFVATLHSEKELRKRQATYITAVVLWRFYAFAGWSSD